MSNNKRTRGAGLIELECATREEEEEWNTGRASDKGRLASEYRSGCAFLRPRGDLHRAEQFHAISSEQATLVCCWRSSWPAFLAFTRSQSFCARHGVLAVVAAHAWESAAPTRRSTELTAVRASEPLALLRSETNPTVAHTFIARPRSSPAISSPAYRRLEALQMPAIEICVTLLLLRRSQRRRSVPVDDKNERPHPCEIRT
jgi:hypothetical protein